MSYSLYIGSPRKVIQSSLRMQAFTSLWKAGRQGHSFILDLSASSVDRNIAAREAPKTLEDPLVEEVRVIVDGDSYLYKNRTVNQNGGQGGA